MTTSARQPHWLNKTDMAKSLGLSQSAFAKRAVEPVAKIGRETFFTVRSVIANRIRSIRRQHNRCEECGMPDSGPVERDVAWSLFCPTCRSPCAPADLLSRHEFWEGS